MPERRRSQSPLSLSGCSSAPGPDTETRTVSKGTPGDARGHPTVLRRRDPYSVSVETESRGRDPLLPQFLELSLNSSFRHEVRLTTCNRRLSRTCLDPLRLGFGGVDSQVTERLSRVS